MIKHLIWLALFLPGLFLHSMGQNIPEPMKPRCIVNDFTKLFSTGQRAALEKKLSTFNKNSSTQIAVVTIADLEEYDVSDYAARLGEKWGVGQEGKDNGIVILIKPKQGGEKGQVAISVGYGLEGVIPDATASRIIRNEIIPAFQKEDYYGGIDRATDVLINLSKGEYTADEYDKKGNGGMGIIVAIFLFIVLFSIISKRRGDNDSYTPGHSSGGGFFFFPMGGGSGGFGSFSSGSGSFGGFGGGDFGGGGASGDW